MPIDFSEFNAKLPYASELFGVYQPLLGWRSRSARERVAAEGLRITDEIIRDMVNDLRVRREIEREPRPLGPIDPVPSYPEWLSGAVGAQLRASVEQFVKKNARAPEGDEWSALVSHAALRDAVMSAASATRPGVRTLRALGITLATDASLSSEERASSAWHRVEGSDLYVARSAQLGDDSKLAREAVVAGTLRFLGDKVPGLLNKALLDPRLQAWLQKRNFVDPLADFDPEQRDAVLSPIGVLHLFREYFFEGKSFAGQAVGHVWLSPGSSLELYEVHTRKRVEERRQEVDLEVTRRSEASTTEQDELSNAVSEQNGRNTSLGVTASAGVNFGVVQSSTSANVSLGQTRNTSEQTARKHMRQQSEKLSSEIRQSVRTAFRTSVEVEDTQSRRYTLNNTTQQLVNYEMRRKMRRVGVQVQRLGAQLCWQVYIDDPGLALAIAQLVHVAKPSDLDGVPPPEAPPELAARESDLTYDLPFAPAGEDRGPDELHYSNGVAQEDRVIVTVPHLIVWRRRVDVLPPEPGYELATVTVTAIDRVDPEKRQPEADVRFELPERGKRDHFLLLVPDVNFQGQPSIKLGLRLGWAPTQATLDGREAAYQAAQKEFKQEKARAAYVAYVEAVRDRIKLAGQVQRRPSEDLRDEERTVVYRRMIERLTAADPSGTPTERHVTAELIRSLFDVDRMLYFVAPDWWTPRKRFQRQNVTAPASIKDPDNSARGATDNDEPDHLAPSNLVSWGGTGGGRDTYLVTEESAPAPLGASLGWTLQLDGDAHRNAFLNTPWVKAVLPITPGREAAAIKWLRHAHVEGEEGLDEFLPDRPNVTVEQAVLELANTLRADEIAAEGAHAADRVFETGFDPLAGGTRVGDLYPVFDSWIEVLPTDQIIAVEYEPEV